MWARVLRWLGFAPQMQVRPVRVPARPVEFQDWNGTILSTESYR